MYILKNKKTGEIYKDRQSILNSSSFNIPDLEATWPAGWDSIDWTQEPSESLENLFKQRAVQLRDSYDYLILYFSGGSDSQTALNIFKRYNIPLDEVVVGRFVDHELLNLPYVKPDYGNRITNIKIDRDFLEDFHYNQKWLTDGFGYSGIIHTLSRNEVYFWEQHGVLKPVTRKGNVAHIYGIDKPLIKVNQKKYYCTLSSNIINFNVHNQSEYKENFFTSETFPKLQAKQCHIVMNYWKKNYPKATKVISESSYADSRDVMNNLLRDPYDSRNNTGGSSAGGMRRGLADFTTEAGKLLRSYKKDKFHDTYISGVVKPYFSTDASRKLLHTSKFRNDIQLVVSGLEKRMYLGDMINE